MKVNTPAQPFYKPHESVGDSTEVLSRDEIFPTSLIWNDEIQQGKTIIYEDPDSDLEFTGTVLGFDNFDGRILYVKIGIEYTLLDAFIHSGYIISIN